MCTQATCSYFVCILTSWLNQTPLVLLRSRSLLFRPCSVNQYPDCAVWRRSPNVVCCLPIHAGPLKSRLTACWKETAINDHLDWHLWYYACDLHKAFLAAWPLRIIYTCHGLNLPCSLFLHPTWCDSRYRHIADTIFCHACKHTGILQLGRAPSRLLFTSGVLDWMHSCKWSVIYTSRPYFGLISRIRWPSSERAGLHIIYMCM